MLQVLGPGALTLFSFASFDLLVLNLVVLFAVLLCLSCCPVWQIV